ncbi:MAG: mechanosensitive ion channel family protein [Flavobacteriales bacterium]|nr:mechanosensitive ion channel family protein [Flavobacteriales bacterium]
MTPLTFDLLRITGWTLAGALAGWGLDLLILRRFRVLARRSANPVDDVVVDAFSGLLPIWAALAGLRLALRWNQLPELWNVPLARGVFILAVGTICLLVARMASGWLHQATSRVMAGASRSASIIGIITRTAVYLVGVLVILHDLGISITPMLTALGVGGLAVALALQDTLTNLFAGIQLLASRQLNVGDFVKLESGEEGYLTDITWRNTTIRALSNHLIVVPNAKLASSIIQNHQQPEPEEAVVMQVGVSYDSDLDHVEQVTIETAREVIRRVQPELKGFDPFIRYHTFADSSIGFSVILRAKEFTERYVVMHEFVKALHRRYKAEGIVIPYPMRTLQIDMQPSLIHEH